MFNLNQTPGRIAIIDGKEHLFFSGYSYLGMNHVPEFIELVKEGLDKYGLLFPSSRISNTQLDLYYEFEAKLSEIIGIQETVCFSSGFLAGRAVAELFKHENFSCAPQTHPAICLEVTSGKFEAWKQKATGASVLLFDSVNPLTAEVNDVTFTEKLSKKITCVIDDSHGIGILNEGKGINRSLPQKENIDYIIPYSLSKAYNLVGGAVGCSQEMASKLRKSSFYTASTSISPAFAFAFLNGQQLYEQQRKKLQKNIDILRTVTHNKFNSHPELPIFILPGGTNEKALAEAGIIISSFAYPDPTGEKIKRIVLNALHTEDDLQQLVEHL